MNDILAVQRDSANGDGFTYDLTQEITGFQREATSVNLRNGTVTGGTPNSMAFDGCGNRTTLNAVNTTFNNMNQPTGTGITYENKGNLKTYNGWTYTYDAQNRLITATNGTTTANFKYDGKNRQISRSITGSAITFSVWDDWELVEEYTTSNVRTSAYLQGAHGPIKSLLNNIYFYQDELGSTSHIASSTGSLLEYYTYDLNGKLRVYSAGGVYQPGATPQVKDLFTGERYVAELGLYDLRNRYMSPDLARFLQPDPIGFKGDASNLYRYCGNDWANQTDPTGLVYVAAGAVGNVDQKQMWDLHKQGDPEDPGYNFQSNWSAQERSTQVNVEAHSGEMHAESAREALNSAIKGIVDQTYHNWQAAGKAGALADYKATQASVLEGHPQEFWGCIFVNHQTGDYEITAGLPGTGSGAGAVAGVSGGFSDMKCPPADGYGLVGGHYSHLHSDMIRGNAKDIKALNDAHWKAVVAAPRPAGALLPSPMYQGYDGWTHKFYEDPFFQKLD